jgi:hypothetical protein
MDRAIDLENKIIDLEIESNHIFKSSKGISIRRIHHYFATKTSFKEIFMMEDINQLLEHKSKSQDFVYICVS